MSCGRELAWYDNIPVVSYLRAARPLPGLRRRRSASSIRLVELRHRAARRGVVPRVRAGRAKAFVAAVLLRDARGDLRDRPRAPDRPERDRPAGGRDRARRRMTAARSERRVGARRLRRRVLPLSRRARLPEGDGHGRRQARAPARGDARPHRPRRADARDARRARARRSCLFARHGSAARKMAIPFAPFLALGGVVALFFGDELLDAYLSLF